ncbi:MgtC/SapB family protein [Wenzhouxiangella sp. XN201]|uniref:MgtC/SapB family protein n=1 Tax=Wenzhouxiangella sp. XN201 TaxID=2710755 RepID=UPI0013CAE4FF|nr:MgtC/SapB family protein [Wenzhouxiangella sp. XN201]NEZ03648.1 MgtC/SapB family protein [Wenzhouxiangella sp. XN201]
MSLELGAFFRLAVALAIGLLIGIERGWQRRDTEEGQRVAGLRTYSLIGLLGGVVGIMSQDGGYLLIGLVFVGLAIASATAYMATTRAGHDFGITSETAALATYLLAVLAGVGEIALAAAAAIVMALLLGYKESLHGLLNTLRREELTAGLKLLLISVVLLPILPNRGFGPWEALNPFVIWWMVVLIAAISFFGYIAIRVAGPRRGIVFGGLFGGMASSTATTLAFARIGAREGSLSSVLAAGILLACGSMIARMMIVATVIHAPLLEIIWLPAVVLLVTTLLPVAAYLAHRPHGEKGDGDATLLRNPMELKSALLFGALLAVVMLLGKALSAWAGDLGLWALAAASGIADVDAITLSLSRMSQSEISLQVAVIGIMIAASANSLTKGGMALAIGGRALGWRVLLPLGTGALLSLLVAFWQYQ